METETVVRLRPGPGGTDPYSGDPVTSWQTPTERPMTTLAPAEPRPSGEPVQDARNAVTSGFTLYLSESEDVTAGDRFRVRGDVYDVLGKPARWSGAGLVVQVDRTEG